MRSTRTKASALALVGLLSLGAAAMPGTAHAIKFSYLSNHPDLKWMSIETEHFVVHYPVSKRTKEQGNDHEMNIEWSARKVAEVAETMWEPMCAEFNYYLKERVHIVLLDQSDDLQGFTIPSWDWIQISANPGASFSRMRGRMEWFSDVLVHEFAHVVSLKAYAAHSEGSFGVVFGGLYQDGVRDMETGVNFMIGDGDSVFWTEGGAEYWSDNTGWNWWTASRDQNIRTTVLEDRLLTFDEWHHRAGKRDGWGDGERYYQQGYSFGLYLRQRFGPEVYTRVATEFSKGWRPEFSSVFEDVTGVPAERLYWDWRRYLSERYAKQAAAIRARGEVEGRELTGGPREWDFEGPDARDAWNTRSRWDREHDRERSGRYQNDPRIHPDKPYWGVMNYGSAVVTAQDPDDRWAFTGEQPRDAAKADRQRRMSTSFEGSWDFSFDFVPGQDQAVVTGHEDGHIKPLDMRGFNMDGYNLTQLYVWDVDTYEEADHGRTEERAWPKQRTLRQRHVKAPKDLARPIPNTLRGNSPAVSPDGKRVAFLQYRDGGHELAIIDMDGNNKRELTSFADGTWMQQPDWSPDGKSIVVAIHRNYQQNLYLVDVATGELSALTNDEWEEQDPHWAADGNIYFSADADGVLNIYRMNPESHEVTQLTNVVNSAISPQLTHDGNLVYVQFTAFGWKLYGLPADEFFDMPAGHLFRTADELDEALVKDNLAFREDLSHWEDTTRPYKTRKSWSAPSAVPIFRFENDNQSDWGLQGGFQVSMQDYVQNHELLAFGLVGEDNVAQLRYTFNGWYPSFDFYGIVFSGKNTNGFQIDQDDDPETTGDQEVLEIRRAVLQRVTGSQMTLPFNSRASLVAGAQYFDFALKNTTDAEWKLYQQNVEGWLGFNWSSYGVNAWGGALGANPRPGRNVDSRYARGFTDIVYRDYGGVVSDSGQLLEDYVYNRYELRWTENVDVPHMWHTRPFEWAQDNQHRMTFDLDLGWIDRNVSFNDEFNAGGQHPYNFGYGNLRPNTQFAGYPFFSLNGETKVILGAAYRFPITRRVKESFGPLFVHGIYAQLGGTAGNLWSYRPPDDPTKYYRDGFGDRVAYDEDDVTREIPFVHDAYRNGNYLLYDASVELRVQTVMFHTMNWDSFLRVAWGFNEIRGYGDVNGDGIFDTADSALGDELSSETEKPGPRIYIGLGTGW